MNYAVELLLNQLNRERALISTYEYIIYHPKHGLSSEQILAIKRELMISSKRAEDIKIALEQLSSLRHGEVKLKKAS